MPGTSIQMLNAHFLFIPFVASLPIARMRAFSKNEYLYASMEQEEVWPVQEYTKPVDAVKGVDTESVLPDFLSDPNSGHRVIEFYSPWCSHCQHYKSHYIALAKNTTAVANSLNMEVDFHAVSCTVHRQLCQKIVVRGYPTIRVYPAGDIVGKVVPHNNLDAKQLLQAFGVNSTGSGNFSLASTIVGETKPHHGNKRRIRTKEDIYSDAMLSFEFAMRNSIFMTMEQLNNTTNDALYKWLALLQATLPPKWNIHKLLTDIIQHMDESPLSEKVLVQILDHHQQPEDHNKTWSLACTHGDNLPGYSCGLWELFHIMTVGVVEWNSQVIDTATIIPTTHAANVLHNYVANFFACDVCRKHFIADYNACAYERCTRLAGEQANDWKQLPLWLWETHNGVNVRLMKERAARDDKVVIDNDEIEAYWPSRAECPQCWGKAGMWNEEFMYKHLRMEYWPEVISSASAGLDLPIMESNEHNSTWSKSPVVVLFVTVVILITVILLHGIKKWNSVVSGRHKKSDIDWPTAK